MGIFVVIISYLSYNKEITCFCNRKNSTFLGVFKLNKMLKFKAFNLQYVFIFVCLK